ncbi:hypothetical protein SAMN05444008_114124 [Cnuella takakiae]|uniref:Uncharacterized protein n=2 Tax=Cnuella takakiae TaxID=1302690 RepID=A0A1M5FRK0_9BACT|nr:hypothetical protein SAMN05444008_114124 [Cnuella takakiae]
MQGPMSPISLLPGSFFQLVQRLRQYQLSTHPASGWFKQAPKPNRKPAAAMPRVLSPDSVHLRAGAKRDPLRKNPAP